MADKPTLPIGRRAGETLRVRLRIWSELAFQYIALDWRISMNMPLPQSQPPFLYIDRVDVY